MRTRALLALAAMVATMAVLGSPPAGAAISTSVSGTTLAIIVTGDELVQFACSSGSVLVNGTAVAPAVSCATLTKVTVNGDGGAQRVRGDGLNDFPFAANPFLSVSLGAGNDFVTDTDQADEILTGSGADGLSIDLPSVPNTTANLGGDGDYAYVYGSSAVDTMTAATSGTALTVTMTAPSAATTTILNAENLVLRGLDGNDTLSAAGVTVASAIDFVQIDGSTGNDTVIAGPGGTYLNGEEGTNTVVGGIGNDVINSWSSTDVINLGGGYDSVIDDQSLRSGSRTITGGTTLVYGVVLAPGDAVARVRRGAASGSALVTASLSRPGQQPLSPVISAISIYQDSGNPPGDRDLADVVALDGDDTVAVIGDGDGHGIVDVTVPAGTWSVAPSGEVQNVVTDSPSYGNVSVANVSDLSVHGPWTNKNRGWVHRVHRDLLFRFASTATLDEGQAFLTAGTVTRAQVTADLMDSDEYRGLDVDRVFVDFLRRGTDPAGRTYWIGALASGRSLRTFRAQLFGSSEYFTKAGGTNAQYVVKAYQDVLGRAPDASGRDYWVGRLAAGVSRGTVALQFLSTSEARRNIVEDQFLRFLDRLPTATESSTWVSTLGSSATGEQDLIAFLVNSTAYYNRT